MDYFALSLLRHLMSLLSALAPLLITAALFLMLMEALRANHVDDVIPEGKATEHEAAGATLLVPRP